MTTSSVAPTNEENELLKSPDFGSSVFAQLAKRAADAAEADRDRAAGATSKEEAKNAADSAAAHEKEAVRQKGLAELALEAAKKSAAALEAKGAKADATEKQDADLAAAKAEADLAAAKLDAIRATRAAEKASEIAKTA